MQELDAAKGANGILKVFLAVLVFLMLAMLATLYRQNRPDPQRIARAPSRRARFL